MPFTGKSPDPNPCMPFIVNVYFLIHALEIYVLYNLKLGIKIYNAQSSMSNLQAFHDYLALQLVKTFLRNFLKAPVMRTVTNGFPSVTSVLQHLVFKMSFHDVLFTAPSPLPGGNEKVILSFQRSPVNYSTGLCTVYSLHLPLGSLTRVKRDNACSAVAGYLSLAVSIRVSSPVSAASTGQSAQMLPKRLLVPWPSFLSHE